MHVTSIAVASVFAYLASTITAMPTTTATDDKDLSLKTSTIHNRAETSRIELVKNDFLGGTGGKEFTLYANKFGSPLTYLGIAIRRRDGGRILGDGFDYGDVALAALKAEFQDGTKRQAGTWPESPVSGWAWWGTDLQPVRGMVIRADDSLVTFISINDHSTGSGTAGIAHEQKLGSGTLLGFEGRIGDMVDSLSATFLA